MKINPHNCKVFVDGKPLPNVVVLKARIPSISQPPHLVQHHDSHAQPAPAGRMTVAQWLRRNDPKPEPQREPTLALRYRIEISLRVQLMHARWRLNAIRMACTRLRIRFNRVRLPSPDQLDTLIAAFCTGALVAFLLIDTFTALLEKGLL